MEYGANPELEDDQGNNANAVVDQALSYETKAQLSVLLFGKATTDSPEEVENALKLCSSEDPSDIALLAELLGDHPEMINQLISVGETDETTLLYTAARANNVDAVGLLLACDADPNLQIRNGSTPLHVACYRGYLGVVDALLEGNKNNVLPDPALENKFGERCTSVFSPNVTPEVKEKICARFGIPRADLFRFVGEEKSLDALEEHFKSFPLTIDELLTDPRTKLETTLVAYAISKEKINSTATLLKAGAKVDASSFQLACKKGNTDLIDLLIQYGCDHTLIPESMENSLAPDAKAKIAELRTKAKLSAMTPEHAAIYVCDTQDADITPLKTYITANPARIDDQVTSDPKVPAASFLYKASRSGNAEAVKFLVQNHANIGVQGSSQNTPLHVATYRGHLPIIKILIEAGSDVNKRNQSGELPDEVFVHTLDAQLVRQIKAFYKDEREKIERDAKEKKFQEYLDSIPKRKLPATYGGVDYTLATQYWNNAITHALPKTIEALVKLISGLLSVCVRDNIAHSMSLDPRNENPVSLELATQAVKECQDEFEKNLTNLDEYFGLAPPQIIPDPVLAAFAAQAENALSRAALTFFESRFILQHDSYFSQMPFLQKALEDEIMRTKGKFSGKDRAILIFDKINEICTKFLADAADKATSLKSIGRSHVILNCIPELKISFGQQKVLYPRCELMKACMSDPSKSVARAIVSTTTTTVEAFIQKILTVNSLPNSVVQKIITALNDTKLTPFNKLAKIDNFVVQGIRTETEEEVKKYIKSVVDKDEVSSAACQEYFDGVVEKIVKAAVDEYTRPGTTLTASLQILTNPPYERRVFEPQLTDRYNVDAFFKKRRTPSPRCHGGKTGPNSQIYVKNIVDLQKNMKHPVSLTDLILIHLRNAHLHYIWSEVVAYSKLEEVESAFRNSDVVLVEAGTGSGKSTIVPQYLCHKFDCPVLVTQPRREPTTSIGNFVQLQFGKNRVGFQTSGTKNPCPNANLQYSTDALFIGRALASPIDEGTIVIIDEVHERSSVMDSTLLVLLHKLAEMKKQGMSFKIGLASATVDPSWFRQVCAHSDFNARFSHVVLPVTSPFSVKSALPPGGLLQWIPPGSPGAPKTSNRAKIAAKDAFDITNNSPNTKVLVFLPNITEILDAENSFQALSGGRISCAAIYASATGVSHKLQGSRVVFSNNIAETSLTVPNLTHVLDFNLSVVAKVDPVADNKELEIDLCTRSSYMQRRGRLGRTAPGTYIGYYIDGPAQLSGQQGSGAPLKKTQRCGFDLLSNDHIIQSEMRIRHYLKKSLFTNDSAGLKPLGPGLPPREITLPPSPVFVTSLVPTVPKEVEIAATLNMTGMIAKSFMYALSNNTCTLAILWLAAILESRESPTPYGIPLPQSFAKGLGSSGDFGVLLEVYRTYVEHKKQHKGPKPFDVTGWCKKNGNISELFLKIIDERMEAVEALLTNVLKLNWKSWSTPDKWTLEQLEEALLAGHWRHTLRRVDHKWRKDVSGPFQALDSAQFNGIALSNSSIWFNSPAGSTPEYVMYRSMDCKNGRGWVNYIMSVSEKTVDKFSKHETVTQSMGLFYFQYNICQSWITANTGAGKYITKINTKTNGGFSAPFCKRNQGTIAHQYAELVVTGTRVDVSKRIAKIAEEIGNLIAVAQQIQQAPNLIGGVSTPASLQDLQNISPAVANRFKDARHKRTQQDLTNALRSNNKQVVGLALCNILVNDFQCSPKGGIIRDILVRGMNTFEDIDMDLMPTLNHSTWRSEVQQMCNDFKSKYNFTVNITSSRPGANGTADGMIVLHGGQGIEFEMVAPWNDPFYKPKAMDMTVNNLCLRPRSQKLEQIVQIGVPTVDIVRQLLLPKPQSSPLYNINWVVGTSNKTGEGYSKLMWVEAKANNKHDEKIMQSRLGKMRNKGYWLVEVSTSSVGGTVTLYHGTNPAAAQAIVSTQTFRPGSVGNLGPGVYMSRDIRICKMFGSHILSATVNPGKVENVKGWTGTAWHSTGADTAFLDASLSPRNPPLEEWCIRVPSKASITSIKQIAP